MNPRDLSEVVADLIYEMHEVHSELQAINGRVDRLEQRTDSLTHTIEGGLQQLREKNRQNTDRLIESFERSMEPLINRVLGHEGQLGKLESPK